MEAYDHYLLGRHHLNKRSDSGLRTSITHFEKAAELDPGFGPALAGVADVYTLAAIGYAAIPDAISRARDAAGRALDPSFAMAHFNIGNCHDAAGRVEDALACYTKAVELSDRVSFILSFQGSALARAGRAGEAREILEELRAREEGGASLSLLLAVVHEALGQREDALRALEKALGRHEPAVPAHGTPWLPFATLQDEPRFQRMRAEVRERMGQDQ